MVVTALTGPGVFVRFSVDEATEVLRHILEPNEHLPRAATALRFVQQLEQAVIEASSRVPR